MADMHAAREALYSLITKTAEDLETSNYNDIQKAQATANLALAWRYAAGGQQPGGFPSKD